MEHGVFALERSPLKRVCTSIRLPAAVIQLLQQRCTARIQLAGCAGGQLTIGNETFKVTQAREEKPLVELLQLAGGSVEKVGSITQKLIVLPSTIATVAPTAPGATSGRSATSALLHARRPTVKTITAAEAASSLATQRADASKSSASGKRRVRAGGALGPRPRQDIGGRSLKLRRKVGSGGHGNDLERPLQLANDPAPGVTEAWSSVAAEATRCTAGFGKAELEPVIGDANQQLLYRRKERLRATDVLGKIEAIANSDEGRNGRAQVALALHRDRLVCYIRCLKEEITFLADVIELIS